MRTHVRHIGPATTTEFDCVEDDNNLVTVLIAYRYYESDDSQR